MISILITFMEYEMRIQITKPVNCYTLDAAIDLCEWLRRFCDLKSPFRKFIPIVMCQQLCDMSQFDAHELESIREDFVCAKKCGHIYVHDVLGYSFTGF